MNHKIQAEIQNFTGNEITRKNFMNFYRCVKTLHLLKNLFIQDALSEKVYNDEVKGVQEKLTILREDLKHYDIKRFCELWKIDMQYANISLDPKKSRITVSKVIAKIANLLPQINDNLYIAQTYGQIHEIMSKFCLNLAQMNQTQKNLTTIIRRIITDLINTERQMANKYQKLSDKLQKENKDLLVDNLTKFRVQFDKIYQLS